MEVRARLARTVTGEDNRITVTLELCSIYTKGRVFTSVEGTGFNCLQNAAAVALMKVPRFFRVINPAEFVV